MAKSPLDDLPEVDIPEQRELWVRKGWHKRDPNGETWQQDHCTLCGRWSDDDCHLPSDTDRKNKYWCGHDGPRYGPPPKPPERGTVLERHGSTFCTFCTFSTIKWKSVLSASSPEAAT